MHFILLCILIGAFVMIPQVRQIIGMGIAMVIVGLMVLIGLGLVIWFLVSIFH